MINRLGKFMIACAIAAGTLAWSAPSTTHALFKTALDKGLEAEIREELALPSKEPVTEDEVAILTSLLIDNGENVKTLQGLEEALFLHSVIIYGSHKNLDISALKTVRELSMLAIDRSGLSEEGKSVVDQLEKDGVNIVKMDPDLVNQHPETIRVFIDGEQMYFPVSPANVNGSTMVPFRPLFEKFGLQVGWDQATKKVTGTKEKLKIELTINSKTATVGGRTLTLAAAPTLMSGNTMVPLRFIGEATGRRVLWDGETRSVYIDSTVTSYNFDYLYSNHTIYEGDKLNGVPHGIGTLLYRGKVFYEGSFKNGVIEGTGIMYDLEDRNSYYEGEFKNNRFHGTGKNVYSDGSYYEGTFVDGMREGSGKWLYADDSLAYVGDFSGDALHGEGTIYFDDRTYYKGSFYRGKLQGQGKAYTDGKMNYEGEWLNGNRYRGKSYFEGKLNYEGFFVDNQAHGYGTVYLDNGKKDYRGQFKDNNIIGVGIFYLEDGSRYIGEVYNGFMDGFGFIKQKDGKTITQIGYWDEDEFIGEEEPTVTDDSNIKLLSRNAGYSFVDGIYQNNYDLDRNEAMMFIQLSSQEDVKLFNSLSKEAKAKFINSYVQDRFGDVLGVDHCYTYVMYDEDVYAEATISYELADSAVVVKEYPKGNGTINE
ncbi:stalk domain-containing protein [Paenibacillus sp. LHD-117]|uniref:stalk domain-containing protein n=1 Tax=Paenibacillus sp. LHD-117 TaxID=3071412 RepID=UPI0027E0D02B|nr:stalk domain-containing protein [Paenibacillus sp. LHD-117]MDQ6421704.1 stalk domain-containing protein [Paenibacillus sp. LHD-117]